jgi:hypothetical protein
MSLACPVCGSENTQKVSLIYSAGTSSTNSTTIGAGVVGHKGAVGLGSTQSNAQSALAQRCAPPQKRDADRQGCWALLGIIPAMILAAIFNSNLLGIVAWLLLAGALLASTRGAMRYNREVYPRQYEAWNKRMLCLRCDNMFSP